MYPYDKTVALARTFPCFAPGGMHSNAPGLDPFDAVAFAKHGPVMSHGERAALDFVLSVFNHMEWPFDLHDAYCVWDDAYRNAFLAWAVDPWWE